MDVIFSHMVLDDGIFLGADVPDQHAHAHANIAAQDALAILGHPYEIQVDLETHMRTAPIGLTHTPILARWRGTRAEAVA